MVPSYQKYRLVGYRTWPTDRSTMAMASKTTTRLKVEAGACVEEVDDLQNLVRCELESTACEEYSFVSSYEIRQPQTNNENLAHCLKQETLRQIAVTECKNDNNKQFCTSVPANCEDGTEAVVGWNSCEVAGEKFTKVPSVYGRCNFIDVLDIGNVCVWSPDQCPTDDPYQVTDSCGCEQVRTGACVTRDDYLYCAVSAKACAEDHAFAPVAALETAYNTHCMLCSSSPDIPLGSTTSSNRDKLFGVNRADGLMVILAGSVLLVGLGVGLAVRLAVLRRRNKREAGEGIFNSTLELSAVDRSDSTPNL